LDHWLGRAALFDCVATTWARETPTSNGSIGGVQIGDSQLFGGVARRASGGELRV